VGPAPVTEAVTLRLWAVSTLFDAGVTVTVAGAFVTVIVLDPVALL
jgi:hypothetical protein